MDTKIIAYEVVTSFDTYREGYDRVGIREKLEQAEGLKQHFAENQAARYFDVYGNLIANGFDTALGETSIVPIEVPR